MRTAFTMVELLVVVAIIAILAALVFPVFTRAKEQAKQTQCMSNLRQIGNAIGLYMADHDDMFPQAVDASDKYRPEIWNDHPEFQRRIPYMPLMQDILQPYLQSREVFRCPADIGTEMMDNHPWVEFETRPSMYAVYGSSYFFRTEIAFKYFTQSGFQLPAQVNVLFDGAGHWHGRCQKLRKGSDPADYRRFTKEARYNTLFGDLHAKSLSFAQLQEAWATEL